MNINLDEELARLHAILENPSVLMSMKERAFRIIESIHSPNIMFKDSAGKYWDVNGREVPKHEMDEEVLD